jgi:hypothetical protein
MTPQIAPTTDPRSACILAPAVSSVVSARSPQRGVPGRGGSPLGSPGGNPYPPPLGHQAFRTTYKRQPQRTRQRQRQRQHQRQEQRSQNSNHNNTTSPHYGPAECACAMESHNRLLRGTYNNETKTTTITTHFSHNTARENVRTRVDNIGCLKVQVQDASCMFYYFTLAH